MLRDQGAFSRFFHLFKGLDPFNHINLFEKILKIFFWNGI